MTVKLFIEATSIIVFSLVAMVEGLRLIIYKQPNLLYDPIGPGFYILALSIGLMSAGVAHLLTNYRRLPSTGNVAASRAMRIRLFGSFMVLAVYILLIDFVGYLVATLVFFVLELRLAGVTSWRTNLILTVILAIVYYVIFVRLCDMVFPRGILF